MQLLEVSGAVRPIYGSLGVKRLISFNFYLFYFPGAAAEPLGLRGAQGGNLWLKLFALYEEPEGQFVQEMQNERCTAQDVYETSHTP